MRHDLKICKTNARLLDSKIIKKKLHNLAHEQLSRTMQSQLQEIRKMELTYKHQYRATMLFLH